MKTLKDMVRILVQDQYTESIDDFEVSTYNNALDDLKQEAIEWIKHLEDVADTFYTRKNTELDFEADGYTCNVVAFIQHFFNITDEELK